MKKNSSDYRFCKSWKELRNASIIMSLIFVAFHTDGLIMWKLFAGQSVYRIISGVIICHIVLLAFVGYYNQDYKHLIAEQIIEKSSKRFWIGLLPIIIGEMLNILGLICFFIMR